LRYLSLVDDEDSSDVLDRCVRPFYLNMMRTNALEYGESPVEAIRAAARDVTSEEVMSLLRGSWRPRVMGAWLAVLRPTREVKDSVLTSLTTSRGSLDAPPLAVAAVVLAGPDAIGSLEHYFAADQANAWGAAGLIAAAGEYLQEQHGTLHSLPPPTVEDRKAFDGLLAVAGKLAA